MKQENQKSKKWLLPVVIAAILLLVSGVVLALVFGMGGGAADQPTEPEQVTSKLYWNVDRLKFVDEESGFSNREPAEDGMYHILFTVDGKQETYVVADKKLVNYIDSRDVMGLEFDAEGNVIDVLDIELFASEIALGFFTMYQEGNILKINSSVALNGMQQQLDLSKVKIYDVRAGVEVVGAEGVCEALDKIDVYGDLEQNPTHVYILERQPTADVYWRVERKYDSATKGTSRKPDENGVYTILSAFNGKQVEVKTKDKSLVDLIDQGGRYDGTFAPIFDEDGYMVELLGITKAIRGAYPASMYDVTAVDGNNISAEYKMTGNNQGKTWSGVMHPDCKIYNVSDGGTADVIGEATTLQVTDRANIYTNTKGEAILIYVVHRNVDSPMYYNVQRMYSAGATTRTPDTNGYYVFKLAVDGKIKEFKTKDKDLASRVDSFSYSMFGLEVEGNIIKRAYNPECVTGYYSVGSNCVVTDKIGTIITLTNLTSNAVTNPLMSGDCKVYNVSGVGKDIGAPDEIQIGDQIIAYTGPAGDLRYVYIVSRYTGTPVFWNHTRKYNAKTAETTRVPDEEGYYVFRVASEGKDMTVRTKDKKLASKMDAYNPQWFSLKLRGDIVVDVYPVTAATGGIVRSSYFAVESISDEKIITYSLAGSGTTPLVPSEKLKTYNVSGAYDKTWGEKTSLKVDDQIHALTDTAGKAVIIYVRTRKVDSKLYWNKTRMYNTVTAETTRKPNEDGWYVFDLAVNGQVKQFKTKDKEIASRVDANRVAFGLKLKGDVIQAVYSATSVKGIKAQAVSWWDVYSIKGNKITFRSNIGTDSTFGQTKEFTLAKNYATYDVCGYVNPFGSKVKLEIGDRVQAYTNDDGEVSVLFIPRDNTRKEGGVAYCSHCDKVVTWCPWSGEDLYKSDGHYHLTHSLTMTAQRTAGDTTGDKDPAAAAKYDIVIDLNGNTLTANSRSFRVCYGTELTIMDSVGGGTIQAKGLTGIGGNLLIQRGGKVNLVDGTLKLAEGAKIPTSGGVIHLSGAESAFTMTGGAIIGGEVSANGGAIYYDSGKLDIRGGTISGGTAVAGGNIYVNQAKGNITGATIKDGTATTSVGGNIFVGGKGGLTLTDCNVSGGKTGRGGGNIYSSGTLNIDGGKYLVAQQTGSGPNICVETGAFAISGDAYMDGGVRVLGAKSFTVSGKPVIENKGIYFSLWQNDGVKMNADGLEKGASVGIYGSSAFATSTDVAVLNRLVADNCFRSDDTAKKIMVDGNDLVPAFYRCALGHTEHTGANAGCAQELLYWLPWSDAANMPAEGNYYLTKSLSVGNNITLSGDLNLDLNGYNITSTVPSGAAWASRRAFVVDTGASVAITDLSVTPGKVTVKNNNATGATGALFNVKGDLKLYKGNLDASSVITNYEDAVAVNVVSGASFTMYDGSLKGTTGATSAAAQTNGSTVYCAAGATVNVHGGELIGVAGKLGANMHIKGKLNVTGGIFTGGNTGEIGVSENLYVDGADAEVVISGGTFNGAVYAQNFKSFQLTGTPVINKTKTYGLFVAEGKLVNVDGLAEGAKIDLNATGAFATGTDAAELAAIVENKCFVPASVLDAVFVNGQNLEVKITDSITRCPFGHLTHEGVECDAKIVTWERWDKADSLPASGNYFLSANLTLANNTSFKENLMIDLNGHNITGTVAAGTAWANRRFGVVAAGKSVGITDLSGNTPGKISLTNAEATVCSGALFYVYGDLTLYSGVLDGSNLASNTSGGTAIAVDGGKFTMYGGTLKGVGGALNADPTKNNTNGSSICAWSGAVNIHGGEIIGKSGKLGANIYASGTALNITGGTFTGGTVSAGGKGENLYITGAGAVVSITGGTFNGGIYANSFKSFTVGGEPVISLLELNTGLKLSLAAVKSNANVTVTGFGAFASSEDAALLQSWQKQFSTNNGTVVKIDGEDLVTEYLTRCPFGHEVHEGENADCPAEIVDWTPWVSTTSLPTTDGNYVLNGPVTLSASGHTGISAKINLDLNGYDITRSVPAGGTARALYMTKDSFLGITDLSGKVAPGKIGIVLDKSFTWNTCTSGGIIYNNSADLVLYNGVLDGSTVSSNTTGGTTVAVETVNGRTATFTMYGGAIKGVKGATSSGGKTNGSTICAWSGSEVNIHGGQILGSSGKFGANLYIACKLNVTGGTFVGGTLATGGASENLHTTATAQVSITGGNFDGGVNFTAAASVHIGGDAVIKATETGKSDYDMKFAKGVNVVDAEGKTLFATVAGEYYIVYNADGEVMGIVPVTDTTEASTLQVGYAREDITPTAPLPLAGYGNTSERLSENVLDNLYVTCTAITDAEGNTVLLYTQDTINSAVYSGIRAEIAGETGIPEGNIIVAATHTHSAPDASATTDATTAWKTQYKVAMLSAAKKALADRKSAEMYTGTVATDGMNFTRHYVMEDGTVSGSNFGNYDLTPVAHQHENDPVMQVVKFDRDGDNDVFLMNFQAHPTMSGGQTTPDISADFIGAARSYVEANVTGAKFAYFTGATGNEVVDSRIESEKHDLEMTAYGQKLGKYLVDLIPSLTKVKTTAIKVVETTFTYAIDHQYDHLLEQAKEVVDVWKNGNGKWAARELAHSYGFSSEYHASAIISRVNMTQTASFKISAVSVGDWAMVIAPYEMFSVQGLALKELSPYAMTYVVTCANGSNGYMAPADAYDYLSYESTTCKFAKGVAEALTDEYLQLLVALKNK